MFETLGLDAYGPRLVSLWLGLALGLLFGALAEPTRFCFRRGLTGPAEERRYAMGLWLLALAVAVIGTQAAVATGWIELAGHRFLAPDAPLPGIALGGLVFGCGMVLTRGCPARLTVLAATGNLRAATVVVLVAVVALASLRGVLAPLRMWLSGVTLPMGEGISLAALPGGTATGAALIVVPALLFAARSGIGLREALAGVAIGALVPLAWAGTSVVLQDSFDPIAVEAISFTGPVAETMFWTVAASAIAPGFGVGLVGGTLAGAFLAALLGGRLHWQSFSTPAETGRYLAGAAMMGLGGVLAGGCTIGAGLTGLSTLSLAALTAILSIALSASLTDRVAGRLRGASAA